MLKRKMLREMGQNFGQFFSVLLLSFLALAIYAGLAGNVIGGEQARVVFHKETNLANGWIYGEGFTEEQLEAVRQLDCVEEAQLRTSIKASAPDFDGAQVDLYFMTENLLNQPYLIEGEGFDPEDTEGIWIANTFAQAWNIQVGDTFLIKFSGITLEREIKGLVESPEYEYRVSDEDAETNFKTIAFAFLNYEDSLMLPNTQIIVKTEGDALSHEKEIAEAIEYNYGVMIDEDSISGLSILNSEIKQHKQFSFIFSIIFVLIAVLVIATTMNRMVEKQRTQIGTLNALGMKKSKILFHYISYSFFLSLIGAIAGILVGIFALSNMMADMFRKYYVVPGWHSGVDISFAGILILVVGACTLSSYFSCVKIMKVKPAEALRPAPPKKGRKCLFEKLFFWNRLSFPVQYNLRDISRARLRVVMGIFGTAAGMLLMVYSCSCSTLADDIFQWTYEEILNFENELVLSGNISLDDAEKIRNDLSGELVMIDKIEIASRKNATSEDRTTQTITVIEGKGRYNLTDKKRRVFMLEEGEIGISSRVAEEMKVGIGDTVYWHIYSENDWYEAKIGTIYQSPDTQGLTYLRSDYEKLGKEFRPGLLLTREESVSAYEGNEYVSSILNKEDMREAFEKSWENVSLLVGFMVFFSIVMVVVVLYNSGNLSYHERLKEFATLKVLGFQSAQIRRMITLENIWVTVIGILLGAPLGRLSLEGMMNSNGDNYDYVILIPAWNYVLSALLVFVTAFLIGFLFSKRIKKLDMVEVLKGME